MELIAIVPVVLVVALIAWQLAAITWAVLANERELHHAIVTPPAGRGVHAQLHAERRLPGLLPGLGELTVVSEAQVRRP